MRTPRTTAFGPSRLTPRTAGRPALLRRSWRPPAAPRGAALPRRRNEPKVKAPRRPLATARPPSPPPAARSPAPGPLPTRPPRAAEPRAPPPLPHAAAVTPRDREGREGKRGGGGRAVALPAGCRRARPRARPPPRPRGAVGDVSGRRGTGRRCIRFLGASGGARLPPPSPVRSGSPRAVWEPPRSSVPDGRRGGGREPRRGGRGRRARIARGRHGTGRRGRARRGGPAVRGEGRA